MSSLRFLELALLGSFYALRLPRLDSTRVGQRYDDNAKTRYSPRSEDKREREREREREETRRQVREERKVTRDGCVDSRNEIGSRVSFQRLNVCDRWLQRREKWGGGPRHGGL